MGDIPQILRVNRRRKPTSRRKCVTEKTQEEEKGRQERKRRRKKEREEKRKGRQKACGWVNELSPAGGKGAKRGLIRSALPVASARWAGIGCGVGSTTTRGGIVTRKRLFKAAKLFMQYVFLPV